MIIMIITGDRKSAALLAPAAGQIPASALLQLARARRVRYYYYYYYY